MNVYIVRRIQSEHCKRVVYTVTLHCKLRAQTNKTEEIKMNQRDCKYIWLRRKTSVIDHKYVEMKVQLDPNTTRGDRCNGTDAKRM